VGSPVVFRGVQVGQVTEIIVNFDADELSVSIPVIFETDPERFRDVGDRVFTDDKEVHRALVEQGLRAQLQLTSLVTGQLAINMDFYPDTAAKLFGVENARLSDDVRDWQEIPTISTTLQDLEQALAQIDFKDMAEDFKRAMDGIAKLVSSPELQASVSELKETLSAVKTLAQNLDTKFVPLASSIDQTLTDIRAGVGDGGLVVGDGDLEGVGVGAAEAVVDGEGDGVDARGRVGVGGVGEGAGEAVAKAPHAGGVVAGG